MNAAKNRGTQFEHLTALYLREALADPRIDRAPLHGAQDIGDITGVRLPDGRSVVVECKNRQPMRVAEGLAEAERERVAAGADFCMAVFHIKGVRAKTVSEMGRQLVVFGTDFYPVWDGAFDDQPSDGLVHTACTVHGPYGLISALKLIRRGLPWDNGVSGLSVRVRGREASVIMTTLEIMAGALRSVEEP